jgi:hypothetical protein
MEEFLDRLAAGVIALFIVSLLTSVLLVFIRFLGQQTWILLGGTVVVWGIAWAVRRIISRVP